MTLYTKNTSTYPLQRIGQHDSQLAVVFYKQCRCKIPYASIGNGLPALCDHDSVYKAKIDIVAHHMAVYETDQVFFHSRLQNKSVICRGSVQLLTLKGTVMPTAGWTWGSYRRNVRQTNPRPYKVQLTLNVIPLFLLEVENVTANSAFASILCPP